MNKEKFNSTIENPNMNPYAELKEQRPDLFTPIPTRIGVTKEHPEGFPNGTVDGWRDTEAVHFNEVVENGEPLVNIANLKPPIFTTGDYSAKLSQSGYSEPLEGSTIAQYVRSDVAEQLAEAQRLLPSNYRLVVFDAWRSLETQYATYEMCYQSLIDKLVDESVLASNEKLTDATADIISKETQKFISLPSPLPEGIGQDEEAREHAKKIPSPHNTGGSVDLGIVKVDDEWLERLEEMEAIASSEDSPFSVRKAVANFEIARLYRHHTEGLDFGTAFDFAGQQSALTFYETNDSSSEVAADSRRILYNIMTRAGFEPYTEEWWHFNSGNQMAAMTEYRRTGQQEPAKYGNALLTDEQLEHERVHSELINFLASLDNSEITEEDIPDTLRTYGASLETIQLLASIVGDLRESKGFEPTWDMKYRGDLEPEFVAAVRDSQK